jgi:hypothetical protein
MVRHAMLWETRASWDKVPASGSGRETDAKKKVVRMSDELLLNELNLNIAHWEQRRDAEALCRLDGCLSDDLVFRRADRTIVDKAA